MCISVNVQNLLDQFDPNFAGFRVRKRNSTSAGEVARFQRLFANLSWITSGRTSGQQTLVPTFPWINNCLMVTKRDFLEMEASL